MPPSNGERQKLYRERLKTENDSKHEQVTGKVKKKQFSDMTENERRIQRENSKMTSHERSLKKKSMNMVDSVDIESLIKQGYYNIVKTENGETFQRTENLLHEAENLLQDTDNVLQMTEYEAEKVLRDTDNVLQVTDNVLQDTDNVLRDTDNVLQVTDNTTRSTNTQGTRIKIEHEYDFGMYIGETQLIRCLGGIEAATEITEIKSEPSYEQYSKELSFAEEPKPESEEIKQERETTPLDAEKNTAKEISQDEHIARIELEHSYETKGNKKQKPHTNTNSERVLHGAESSGSSDIDIVEYLATLPVNPGSEPESDSEDSLEMPVVWERRWWCVGRSSRF